MQKNIVSSSSNILPALILKFNHLDSCGKSLPQIQLSIRYFSSLEHNCSELIEGHRSSEFLLYGLHLAETTFFKVKYPYLRRFEAQGQQMTIT